MAVTKIKSFRRDGPAVFDRLAIGWAGGISAAAGYFSGLLVGSKTFDWPSVASGAQSSTTVTVLGAALGDWAHATMDIDLAGARLNAAVTATDTVTVILVNLSGAPVDLASGTLKAIVLKVSLTS